MTDNERRAFMDLNVDSGKLTLSLIQNGMDPHTIDPLGEPFILAAARAGSWTVFEALLAAGASPDATAPEGYTAFHHAIAGAVRPNWRYWPLTRIRGSKKIVQYYAARESAPPLDRAMCALALNKLARFQETLAAGLDANSRFADPSRVLLPIGMDETARIIGREAAARMGYAGIADHLDSLVTKPDKKAKSPPKPKAPLSPTLLMWTHALGQKEYSTLLLSAGAAPSLRDDLGLTAQDYAVKNRKA